MKEKVYENRFNKPLERERVEEADRKCMERYCLQSTSDSKITQTVCWTTENGQEREG